MYPQRCPLLGHIIKKMCEERMGEALRYDHINCHTYTCEMLYFHKKIHQEYLMAWENISHIILSKNRFKIFIFNTFSCVIPKESY